MIHRRHLVTRRFVGLRFGAVDAHGVTWVLAVLLCLEVMPLVIGLLVDLCVVVSVAHIEFVEGVVELALVTVLLVHAVFVLVAGVGALLRRLDVLRLLNILVA